MKLIKELNPTKWINGMLFCSALFLISCGVEDTKRNIEKETKTNVKFLESIGEKNYNQATKYLSRQTNDKLEYNEVMNFFYQIEDTLGALVNYDLIKTKSAFDSRSYEKSKNTRSYTYLVNFQRMDSLFFTIFYDAKSESEIGGIVDFAIDESPPNW